MWNSIYRFLIVAFLYTPFRRSLTLLTSWRIQDVKMALLIKCMLFPPQKLIFWDSDSVPFFCCKNPGGSVSNNGKLTDHVYVLYQALLAPLSRRLTRWTYRMGLEPASVRASTLSNMNISETSRPITIKFYLKHHWGGGKAALGFGADQIRTVVSMLTDSSHSVIMGKRASSRFLGCFWSDPLYTCR